jgi:hypothetical protein
MGELGIDGKLVADQCGRSMSARTSIASFRSQADCRVNQVEISFN